MREGPARKGPQGKAGKEKEPRPDSGTAPRQRDLQLVAVPYFVVNCSLHEVIDLVQDQS
jgi:hypothetical protein